MEIVVDGKQNKTEGVDTSFYFVVNLKRTSKIIEINNVLYIVIQNSILILIRKLRFF